MIRPNLNPLMCLSQFARVVMLAMLVIALPGCSLFSFLNTGNKVQPSELQPVSGLVAAKQAWVNQVGSVSFPLDVHVVGFTVFMASSDGTVVALDARTGGDVWRATVGGPIIAGVGSDGNSVAVVSQANEVVVFQAGRELWRQKLTAQAYTAPLVAGGRVFVLAADRSVAAFDGQSGRKLWTQQRPSEPLVLRQSGVMLAVGDTLVAGLGGRLAGLNPNNGSIRWEAPIASPRGINDVERLVDLVGPISRFGDMVCARAFQSSVGCVNTMRGNLLWTRSANGAQGLDGDERFVFGSESDGVVSAWRRNDGERAWTSDKLRYRNLTAPLVVGRSVAVGDFAGYVHLMSRQDGALLNRLSTDGTPIAATPVLAEGVLVVVTRNGRIYGFVPE